MPREDWEPRVRQAATEAGLDPDFVTRLVQAESNWDPSLVSKKGAIGLMQVLPSTAKDYGVTNLRDPKENIKAGIAHLKRLSSKYQSHELLAAAYNAGEGAVEKHGGVPPFKETQAYVDKVDPFAKWAVREEPAPKGEGDPFAKWVPKGQEVVSYWPALMPKTAVLPRIALFAGGAVREERVLTEFSHGNFTASEAGTDIAATPRSSVREVLKGHDAKGAVPLSRICLARSGDKGDTANIGVMARSPKAYEFIVEKLTAQVVKDWFQELCFGKVLRYQVPNMSGLNFLLEESLGGGGTRTLRVDAQGKTFAQALLRQRMVIPDEVLKDAATVHR